jgi:glycosyltransferase involved in cell wall biosynthesis
MSVMPVPNSDVTVVIPAYGPSPHLPAVIDALQVQTLPAARVIVAHSGSGAPTAADLPVIPNIQLLHRDERMVAAAARSLALAEVQTEWTAFLDSDVIPASGWLAALRGAADAAPGRFVAGAIGVAVSGGYWGLCLWAIEFSGVHPYLPDGDVQGGASANLLVRTGDVRRAGGFDGDWAAGEDSLLAAKLREAGLSNWFCAAARGDHVNIPGVHHFLTHLFWLGRWSARTRRRVRLRGSAATRVWPLALGLWLARLGLVYTRVLRWGRGQRLRFLVLAPGIVLGVLVWNGGFLCGLANKSGKAAP